MGMVNRFDWPRLESAGLPFLCIGLTNTTTRSWGTLCGVSDDRQQSGGGSRELRLHGGGLGGVGLHQRVNLLIAPTPDLDILECTSHAGLRSLLR